MQVIGPRHIDQEQEIKDLQRERGGWKAETLDDGSIDTWKKCMSYVDSCCHMHLLPYVSAAGKVRVSKGPEGSGLLYLLLNAYNL